MSRSIPPVVRPAVSALLRLLVCALLVAAGAVALAPAQPAHAGGPVAGGGELVIINDVKVGNPLTTSQCNQSKSDPVVPVTIDASFITSGGVKPEGPYAVATWDGGTGSSDMHFGTGQGHAPHQRFHILMHTLDAYYHGQGDYGVQVIVQDVGLAGGFATKTVTAHLGAESSFGAGLHMKCPILGDFNKPSDFANAALAPFVAKFQSALQGVIHDAANYVCALCTTAYDLYQQASGLFSTLSAYNDTLDSVLNNTALKDPPDPDYQELAEPQPAPVLDPPAKFSSVAKNAVQTLYTRLAAVIGDGRAILTTINRIWGAGDAGDRYWYRRQLDNLSSLAGQASSDLDAVDSAYAAFSDVFANLLSPLPVSAEVASDEAGMVSGSGLPAAQQATLRSLGDSPSDIADITDYLSTADENATIGQDASQALLTAPVDYGQGAGSFDNLQAYATSAADAQPPVVTGIDSRHAPTTGGTTVTLHGTNLASVTGVNFGPSTPTSGQGTNVACTPTSCTTVVPPGTGTVNVTANGPGGPSAISPDVTLTYDAPSTPTVSSVVPALGAASGGTQVQVRGGGLRGANVYFGPVLADSSSCTDTVCTATAPASAHDGRVDVTVVSADGTRSAATNADAFTYTAQPPAPAAPTVSGLSTHTGSELGGDSVTITGTALAGATGVQFGGVDAEDYTVQGDTTITATAPDLRGDGPVDVTVLGPGGSSAPGAATRWTPVAVTPAVASVTPASAPSTGGTTVTVRGTGLNHGTVVVDGSYRYDSTCTPTTCTVSVPPHAPGAVHLEVSTYDGTSSDTAGSAFTYTRGAAPTITGVSPDHGSTVGGSPIAISGTGLAGGTVTIDGAEARFDDLCSDTYCVVYPAAHDAGRADVVVTTATGSSAPAHYSYETPGRPTVTSVYPRTLEAQGITEVTVFGTDLRDGNVHVGNIDAGGGPTQPLCDDTSCTLPVQGDGTTGVHDVTVTTDGGSSPVSAADRVTFTRPVITGVSPGVRVDEGRPAGRRLRHRPRRRHHRLRRDELRRRDVRVRHPVHRDRAAERHRRPRRPHRLLRRRQHHLGPDRRRHVHLPRARCADGHEARTGHRCRHRRRHRDRHRHRPVPGRGRVRRPAGLERLVHRHVLHRHRTGGRSRGRAGRRHRHHVGRHLRDRCRRPLHLHRARRPDDQRHHAVDGVGGRRDAVRAHRHRPDPRVDHRRRQSRRRRRLRRRHPLHRHHAAGQHRSGRRPGEHRRRVGRRGVVHLHPPGGADDQ